MAKQRSFFRRNLFVCWLAILGAFSQSSTLPQNTETKPPSFISEAQLVAGARPPEAFEAGTVDFPYKDFLGDFYGTIIETLESSEMRRRAIERVRKLRLDLDESKTEVQAHQKKGSAIFVVRAFGTEPKYTRAFLDALLDEFIAFRSQIREAQRNKALTTLTEDVVRRERSLKEKRDKLTEFEKTNDNALLRDELDRLTNRTVKIRDERDVLNRKKKETPAPVGLEKQIAANREELTNLERQTLPILAKLATHNGLSSDYQDSKKAFDAMLDLVCRFKIGEDLSSDHVTILERASGAVKSTQK